MGIVSNYEVRKLKFRKPRGILGGLFQFAKFTGEKQRLQSKMGSSETAISEMGDMARNTLLRVVTAISGYSGGRRGMGTYEKLKTIQFRERATLKIRKGGRKHGK